MRLLVFYLSLGLVRVCEIEMYHMGENNDNPNLVREKKFSHIFCTLVPYQKEAPMEKCQSQNTNIGLKNSK